jgi:putrescine aminotransferase
MQDAIERSLAAWQAADSRHYLHPFTDHRSLAGRGSRVIVRGEGVYVYDANGRQILDGMSGLWCVNLGYGRRELVQAAARQMEVLPYYNSFFQCTHPVAIELAERLAELTPPQFDRVFFTGSGSEANDTVVRMVRRYWDLLGQPERKIIISRENAYHGSTIAAASLGGMQPMHAQGGLPIPGVVHIRQPYWYGLGGDLDPDAFGLAAARELEAKIGQLGAERVAAFIGEPIQGAGGVVIPPETYWPEIQRICDRHGILLVADEVITGFGRTGDWFGSQHYGLRPDLMPFAKGVTSGYLPLGGVMVADRVADVLVEQGGEFFHGFTYSGHPAACAVAIRTLEILRCEGLVERIRDDLGPYFAKQWSRLAAHPIVGQARSRGLFGAVELVADREERSRFPKAAAAGERCRDLCFEHGLVMRHVGETMIAAPPFVCEHRHVDELVEKAWHCLDLTARSLADDGYEFSG